MSKTFKIWLIVFVIALSFAAGFTVSEILPRDTLTESSVGDIPQELKLVEETWQIIFDEFIAKDRLDPKELSEGAIRGMIEALGDPYTSYLDAELYQLEQSDYQGSFEGIGAVVTIENGQLVIVAPIEGSPAEKAGIEAGDIILKVNDEPTEGMTFIEAILKIRGKRDTEVTLTVLHQGESVLEVIKIVRDVIQVPSVRWEMLSGNIAYLKISHFQQTTNGELEDALRDARRQGAVGIVLDLRDNPGGLLTAAVDVASQFLEDGAVLYELDSQGQPQPWSVKPGGLATDLPLAVLVNKSSASASEVVAAALQDQGRAPLIGTKTYGKGSVQIIRELSDGSALYITFARWLTPDGYLIEGEGLTPNFIVTITEEDRVSGIDLQLERAIEWLKEAERQESSMSFQQIMV